MVHEPLHQARRQGSLHLQVSTSLSNTNSTVTISTVSPRTMFGVDYCSPSEDKSYSGRLCVGSCKEDSHEDEVGGRHNNCSYHNYITIQRDRRVTTSATWTRCAVRRSTAAPWRAARTSPAPSPTRWSTQTRYLIFLSTYLSTYLRCIHSGPRVRRAVQ